MEATGAIITYKYDPADRSSKGLFAPGNTISKFGGRPRGVKNQLGKLRDVIFDALFEPIGPDGELRLQAAIQNSRPEHILALAGKLVPKSVELVLGGEEIPVPIVLDAIPLVTSDETKKPAIVNNDNNGRKVLNLENV